MKLPPITQLLIIWSGHLAVLSTLLILIPPPAGHIYYYKMPITFMWSSVGSCETEHVNNSFSPLLPHSTSESFILVIPGTC